MLYTWEVIMAKVSCRIDGRENSAAVLRLASDLIEEVRAPSRQSGIIWIEYLVSGEAQVHWLPEGNLDDVKLEPPNLTDRF